jgi:outer membrane protein OmpA-like peptidoglycan-associated protein
MKVKQILLLLFIFTLTNIFSQTKIEIYGTVKDQDNNQLDNIKVLYFVPNGIGIETITDSLGRYKLNIPKSSFLNVAKIVFDQDQKAFKNKHIKDTTCLKYNSFYTKVWRKTYKLDSLRGIDTIRSLNLNQTLDNICELVRFPGIIFDKNSSIPKNNVNNSGDYKLQIDTINFIKCFMNTYPETVITIWGHCGYDEANKSELSIQRANYVKEKLIAFGLNPKRIKISGNGDNKLLVRKETVNKAETEELKALLIEKNRRCNVRIDAWDFKE